MAEQKRTRPQRDDPTSEQVAEGVSERDDVVDETEASTDDQELDDLLDEIDEVLEENPEDFVRNYVQKGGQ